MILPNQLTVLRIILTPVFVFFLIYDSPYFKEISVVIFILAAITDWYDGWLARKFNYITAWGKFWDPMADKILTAGAYFCLVYYSVVELWMVIIILFRDFTITGLRGYADHKNVAFPTSRYAKWKTAIQMIFLYYALLAFVLKNSSFKSESLDVISSYLLNEYLIFYGFLFVTIITLHSGILYIYRNRNLIIKLFEN